MPDLFEIEPIPVGSFLDLDPIFPRFQRKSTWTPEQRFRLMLSVFKGYPLGTVVVKTDSRTDSEGFEREVTLLLDGRQRFETLRAFLANPEEAWLWARRVLKVNRRAITGRTSQSELIDAFRDYVDDYFFGQEDWEEPVLASDTQAEDLADEEAPESTDETESAPSTESAVPDEPILDPDTYGELEQLLKLLLFIHDDIGVTTRRSGFRRAFDFRTAVSGLPYYASVGTSRFIDPTRLVLWIRQTDERLGSKMRPSRADFKDWLLDGNELEDQEKLEALMETSWDEIKRALTHLDYLTSRVRNTRLGFIRLTTSATPQDDKKIFEIINSGGTQLTLPEILSATAAWRTELPALEGTAPPVASLYEKLRVEYDGTITKWDLAATVLDRINGKIAFGVPEVWDWANIGPRFDRKLTLGFRLLSGWYEKNLMKNAVARLAAKASVEWSPLEFDDIVNESQNRLQTRWLFKQLLQWRFSFAGDMSDALAMNFVLLTAKNWQVRGRPTHGADAGPRDAFDRDCLHLFDRSVWEYLTGQWRGSSDSRIARNLSSIEENPAIARVPDEDWISLVDDLLGGTIEGEPYAHRQDGRLRCLLTYVQVLTGVGPPEKERGDIDHLIPQGDFQTATPTQLARMHHIANLELLPHSVNLERRGVALHDMTSLELREELRKYSRIQVSDFARYGVTQHLENLIADRGRLLRKVLTEHRSQFLSDPSNYHPPRDSLWVTSQP